MRLSPSGTTVEGVMVWLGSMRMPGATETTSPIKLTGMGPLNICIVIGCSPLSAKVYGKVSSVTDLVVSAGSNDIIPVPLLIKKPAGAAPLVGNA